MTTFPHSPRALLVPSILWILIFLSSCSWRPYYQKGYESRIGQKMVAHKEEPVLEYESGLMMKYDKSKRGAVNRKLYYMGLVDSTLQFLWQRYDLSTFSATTNRTLEKSPMKVELQPFPFTVSVNGFSFMVHEADTSHITYTLLTAQPTDLPDSTELMKLAPR